MSSSVEQIKERLSISDIVGAYLKLEKAGASLKAKCPFHNEKTPSFFVSPSRGTYYCFGCGAKGDIFTFVEKFEGTDFVGALKILADRAGIVLSQENAKVKGERERLSMVMEEATRFFEHTLFQKPDVEAYLSRRALSKETIAAWRIGFAPREWRFLASHLFEKGITESEMERAGLVKRSEDGKSSYDRFRGRIMFPLFDGSGRVIAFSGRIFEGAADEAKYINSPETILFSKSRALYGFNQAKEGIRKFGFSIIVEGQMDLLMSHQVGFSNTVATSGTALSTLQVEMLKRISPNLLILYDADAAGIKAALRCAQIALARGMEVKVAALPDGLDPADAAAKNPEVLKEAVKKSRHVIEFYLETSICGESDKRKRDLRVVHELLPLVSLLPHATLQSHFISLIVTRTKIKEDALWSDLKRIDPSAVLRDEGLAFAPASLDTTQKKTLERLIFLARRLYGVILWQRTLTVPAIDPALLCARFEEAIGKSGAKEYVDGLTEELRHEMIFEAEAYYEGSKHFSADIEFLINDITIERLKKELEGLIHGTEEAERVKDHLKALSFLKRSQDISATINSLRKLQKNYLQ